MAPINQFLINVASDRLSATIRVACEPVPDNVSVADVETALKKAHIAVNDGVRERTERYVRIFQDAEGAAGKTYEIATGIAATDGTDGTILWEDALTQHATAWNDDAPVDFYNVSSIVTVAAGARIGRIQPPQPGTDGVDVHGNVLHPEHDPVELALKDGVSLDEDGESVISAIDGKIVHAHHELSVRELVEIAGDVDFETGNLDLTTDAVVGGSVKDRFSVKTSKGLVVGGAIEAATIDCAGDITVRGGILNRSTGHVIAGGAIVARFCDEANLRSGGDVRLAKETMNSRVHTAGWLHLPAGAVIGGSVYARRGVEVQELGSEANVPTSIVVGLHNDELCAIDAAMAENEKRRSAVEKIRQTLAPLVAHLKRLTPEQRERVTEMMFQADMLDAEITKSESETTALRRRSLEERPGVLVADRIHERVSITIDDRIVTFAEEFLGPVRIERRKIDNYTAMVAVHPLSGSVTELRAHKVSPKKAPADPAPAAVR